MNCIIIDDDNLSCRILEGFIEKTEGIEHLRTFNNPVDAINEQNWSDVDLIFLDVEMPDMTGLDFLSTIEDAPRVIIVSSNSKYAMDAFDFSVTDFLLKPILYSRFYKGVKKVLEVRQKENHTQQDSFVGEAIFLKRNNSHTQIKYVDIIWIEALENYSEIFTAEEKFTVHLNLKRLLAKLPQNFIRVHRSNIINMIHVRVIEEKEISMALKGAKTQRVPVGKSYRDDLLNKINSI